MRAVLVGDVRDRAQLRQSLALSQIEVVGEAATISVARAAGYEADAFILAARSAPAGDQHAPTAEPLTPREMDVLQQLAEGLPNKTIAKRLGISDQTVKFHLASICGKLGAQNRTDAVRLAIQRGIIAI
ncbi:MAG: response regulator transcription factor [Acidobacteriota bacterium]